VDNHGYPPLFVFYPFFKRSPFREIWQEPLLMNLLFKKAPNGKRETTCNSASNFYENHETITEGNREDEFTICKCKAKLAFVTCFVAEAGLEPATFGL
jgi:hypothetical protein